MKISEVLHEAERALIAAKIEEGRAALAAIGDPKREEWAPLYRDGRVLARSGRVGVLQVREADTEFPENMASYSYPEYGAIFVRICKKDGTLGKQIDRFMEATWRPIGAGETA